MDVNVGQTERAGAIDPVEKSAALADARRKVSQSALQSAEAAETRRADQRQATRAIIEHALGANTRLSIGRNENLDSFIYRAIDQETGEVIHEWPPVQFVKYLEQNGAIGLETDALRGLVVDEQA